MIILADRQKKAVLERIVFSAAFFIWTKPKACLGVIWIE